MNLKFRVEDQEVLDRLKELSAEDKLQAWAEAILRMAIRNAETKIGGTFGKRISTFIELEIRGENAEIRTDRQNGYIGTHVHFGGPIRTRSGKPLAIPLPNEATAKYNPERLFARELTIKMFRLKSRAGNELLFRKPGKQENLEKPLFVLKNVTAPQRPRPWWPTQEEAEAETIRYFNENF